MCSVKSCSLIVKESNQYLNNCVEILFFRFPGVLKFATQTEQCLLDFLLQTRSCFCSMYFAGLFL